jgi:phosphopantothenoylcysteine decarboxylase/phosphopantothenate--cysteine ligase
MSNPIQNKNIQLGVTGSIAAYKAAELASRLAQFGAQVDVILTQSALQFITPLTFQSVTARRAYTDQDLWGREGHVTHISLGHAAGILVVAPASANTIAKLAHGIGDNLLTVIALAATCPLLIAPAMDAGMYSHPATQTNIEILLKRGAYFVGPDEGHLASGLTGKGRMVDPLEILGKIRWIMGLNGRLKGKKIVVTAGGTQEPIDPVRLITNRSSGKQGYALAQSALDLGAEVTLITAPTTLTPPIGSNVKHVRTSSEMYQTVLQEVSQADLLVMAAAVADFRPNHQSHQKIKKSQSVPEITLERTEDILEAVLINKENTGFPKRVIGFAAETQNLVENASVKMKKKHLDMIVANDVSSPDVGFEVDTNRVTLLFADGSRINLPAMQKTEVADEIIQRASVWF